MSNAKIKAKRERAAAVVRGSSGEPTIVAGDNYREQFISALNWYNANEELKTIRGYLDYHIKHNAEFKDYAYAVSQADDLEVKSLGVISRLVRRDQYVSQQHLDHLTTTLNNLKAKYKKQPVAKQATKAVAAPMSIQERITESARQLAGEIDEQIDLYASTGNADFTPKNYLLSKQVSGAVSKRLGELYKSLAKELGDAASGKDEQLVEAYAHLGKSQLKKFAAFVQGIVDACTQQTVSARAQRAPRVRKAKPASQIVSKLKYMKECAELGLKSINPADIVGAGELWVYQPAKRKLTVYRAADSTLTVRGTSVIGYDVEKSETKTLRKPEDFFKQLTSTGKRAMMNAWKDLRAKTSTPRGRINEEMILLVTN